MIAASRGPSCGRSWASTSSSSPIPRALAATGYERGTIVPIGSTTDWPVFADERIVGQRIAMGAGAHGYSLFVEADDLITAYGATVADISAEIAD